MLYLVATPIGNLADITFRAIETLKACDYILCEDTRHASLLLKHYAIHKPLKSFHKFNEASKENQTIADLQSGLVVALISDAGTPGISDPGMRLVSQCKGLQIPVTSIPGPCAAIVALTCSGLNTDKFQFYGFLPRKEGELKKELQNILTYSGTTICYESANRLKDALKSIQEVAPTRVLVVARELTKKFEEVCRGTAEEILNFYAHNVLKGEVVLLISGNLKLELDWEHLSPEEHVSLLQQEYHLPRLEAIKMAAKLRGVSKRIIYNQVIADDNS